MKTACATLLSLVLLLAQAFFVPATTVAANRDGQTVSASTCCGRPKAPRCACCVQDSVPRPAQTPGLPTSGAPNPLSSTLSAVPPTLWLLPVPPAQVEAAASHRAAAFSATVPVFLRHGVLLI